LFAQQVAANQLVSLVSANKNGCITGKCRQQKHRNSLARTKLFEPKGYQHLNLINQLALKSYFGVMFKV